MNQPAPRQWPVLHYPAFIDTITTVQLFTQIVGKIRLRMAPRLNHSWHVTLYVSARGLTTGSIPYAGGIFQLKFDFIDHHLSITTSQGTGALVSLSSQSVASFYKELFAKLHSLGIQVQIYACPNEVEPAIPFAQDEVHSTYNKEQMHLYWQALVKVHSVFAQFRAGFAGKCSPVHLFWGAFDLAVTRFSGRPAPLHPGGVPNMPLRVMQEAYSHQVSSAGFWPGNTAFPQPAFYAYCYPTPATFGLQEVTPAAAFYSTDMGEFFLPYDAVIRSHDPEGTLLQFLQSTYHAAAITGNWDDNLEFHFFE
ncbi:MAG: hypothetical protein H0X33_10200 [Taibaiella sp.]|nr:hypothetical protein [Taibaiella sp.]